MIVHSMTVGPFLENTYIIHNYTKEALIIDPGCSTQQEDEQLLAYVKANELTPKYLLNTHGHVDHVQGNYLVKSTYGVPLLIHREEIAVLRAAQVQSESYGFFRYHEALPDYYLAAGDEVCVGNMRWQVLFLPGHSPGHIGFYNEAEKTLISGDVLFAGSIGRTDLPGGDLPTLLRSIRDHIFTLPGDVTVYAGHGNPTTVGHERKTNPFFDEAARL